MIVFDKIVNKVLKKRGKVMFKNDIFEIIDPEKKDKYKTILNKIVYRLKSEGFIIPIKNGVYIIPMKEDLDLNQIDLLEKYFFKLLKKYIAYHCQNNYYISGQKSLEIHLKDFSVPNKIIVVNRNINKKVFLKDYCIIFKTINGNVGNKKINLYNRLSKMVKTITFEDIELKVSNLELSLLENALVGDSEIGINLGLLNKAIKKYHKYFNIDNFYYIGEFKYIMSINRLKELTRNIDKKLYNVFLDIIKKNGGLFIGESLRNI